MSTQFVLNAELRTDTGKSAIRRMRKEEKIPAIIYGTGSDPVMLSFLHKDIVRQLENEAFYSHILTVELDGNKQQAVLKDLQRHPSKARIMHMDLLRVSATEKITMQVPLHFTGEEIAPGVKDAGGLVSHQMSNVEIRCFAKDLPEFIEIDMSKLGMNEFVHLTDIKLPDGVEIVALAHGDDHNSPVASIHMPKAVSEEVKPTEGAGAADAAAAGSDDKGGDKS